jgi:aminopeptidase YwaD
MPKHFPFYNPEQHQRIIALLEDKRPLAIVCATARNPDLAGGLYPFPLIEDGDFDIPSVFTTDVEGARLLSHLGQKAVLESKGRRIPAQAENVVARKGSGGRRIVVCAHIDAKIGTPGAVDNGGGVVVLLLLAELLADYDGDLEIEIVALNGEDYYSAPGQKLYLAQNEKKMAEIMLAINLDGVGYRKGKSAYSLYGCPLDLERIVRQALDARDGTMEGPAWYQSDHSIFIQAGIPAVAITSEEFLELWSAIAHTPDDVPDLVDPGKLVESAQALRGLVLALDGAGSGR